MSFVLAPLPYPKDALSPIISEETLTYHHDKHHAAYVTNLNGLVGPSCTKTLEELITTSEGPLFNQAAQVWNHEFFFSCMEPPKEVNLPSRMMMELIERDFETFDKFKAEFTKQCASHFGSGWVYLVVKDTKLAIVSGHDADNPMKGGRGMPVLACDVWEHAYYIDYRNARASYIDGWWKLVNWTLAERRCEALMSE